MAKFKGKYIDTSSLWTDYEFDVSVGGQTQFAAAKLISTSQKVDVMANGRLVRASDYTRDNINHRVTFGYTVPQDTWVLVRVYA